MYTNLNLDSPLLQFKCTLWLSMNHTKTKQNVIQRPNYFLSENYCLWRCMISDDEHSESEFYCLDKLEYFRRTADTGLNCQRLGVMNQVFAAFLKAAI